MPADKAGAKMAGMGGFDESYQRWKSAQDLVSKYERLIYDEGHQLTAEQLLQLRVLRRAAEGLLRQLMSEVDGEAQRLRLEQAGIGGRAAEDGHSGISPSPGG